MGLSDGAVLPNDLLAFTAEDVIRIGNPADLQDLYVAAGMHMVIPQETRLENFGYLCTRLVWKYQKSARDYLAHIAEVQKDCNKRNCTRPDCSMSDNGSLHLHHVTAKDSGIYTIAVYDLGNILKMEKTLNLQVLDAVSPPLVTFQCLSDDNVLATCFVDKGTRPQIQMTINKEMFLESKMNFIKETKSLRTPWNITCCAKNEVSQEMTTMFIKTCPEPLSGPFLDIICHCDGSVEVLCAVASGSDPEYSWIVDGKPLQSDTNSSWLVKENVSMGDALTARNVSCVMWNSVSRVQTPYYVIQCQECGETLVVFERYVKGLLLVMYNALLLHGLMELIRGAPAEK